MKAEDLAEPKTLVLSGLLSLTPVVAGMVLSYYADTQGVLSLNKETVFQIGGAVASIILGLSLLLRVAMKKIGKKEMVAWAKEQGRPICECTATGEIMCVTPDSASKSGLVVYACPKCKSFLFSEPRH